jgi:hypothetical protein
MGACFTGSCVGPQTQIEQSPDLKKACGCLKPQPSTNWEMVANAMPWPQIDQKVGPTPPEENAVARVNVSELEATKTHRAWLTGTELVDQLKTVESRIRGNVNVVFTMLEPHSGLGPEKGPRTDRCKVTTLEGVIGLSCESHYLGNPPYSAAYAPRFAVDPLGPKGTLPIWRWLRYDLLSNAEMHRALVRQELLLVQPDGEVARIPHGTLMLLKEPIGSPYGMHQWDHFLFAAGTGFASYLKEVRAQEEIDAGTWRLTVSGTYGVAGTWQLLVDTGPGNPLVREASFLKERDGSLLLRTGVFGLHQCDGFCLGQSGSVQLFVRRDGNADVRHFELISLSTEADPAHLEQLRVLHSTPLPKETPVFDSTATPTRAVP